MYFRKLVGERKAQVKYRIVGERRLTGVSCIRLNSRRQRSDQPVLIAVLFMYIFGRTVVFYQPFFRNTVSSALFFSSAVMCFPSFAVYGNMFLNLLRLRASCAAALLVSFGKNNRAASLGYPVVYIRFSSRFDECAHRTAFTAKSGEGAASSKLYLRQIS